MRKILAALAVLVCVCSTLPAIDMGFTIGNASSLFVSDTNTWAQGNTGTLWLRADFQGGRLDIAGVYDFLNTLNFGTINGDEPEPYRFDVGITKWAATVSLAGAVFSYELGRHKVDDMTGIIYASLMDGVSMNLSTKDINLWLGADYTGLVLKKNSSVLISNDDSTDAQTEIVGWDHAPPRLVASLGIAFPELVLRQDVSMELSGQIDLRPNAKDPTHNAEFAFRFSGPLLPGLREKMYGIVQWITTNRGNGIAFLAGMKLVYNLPIPNGT